MGIITKSIIHISYTKKMQKQLAKSTTQKLFRSARMSEQRSHQGIKEAECLRQRPVQGIATWYEKVGNQGETKVFLQKIGCGSLSEIRLCEQYPQILPKEFKMMNAKSF